MRVNVYAEEMTDKVEVIAKNIDGHKFTGLRFYLELPVTLPDGKQVAGPFTHRPGDDDSSAITFWGKHDLRVVLRKAQLLLDRHYDQYPDPRPVETMNKYAVTMSETKVVIGIPPRHLTKADAQVAVHHRPKSQAIVDGLNRRRARECVQHLLLLHALWSEASQSTLVCHHTGRTSGVVRLVSTTSE